MSSGGAPPLPPTPDESPEAAELREERKLVGSPHAVAAGAALLALTRAARSFTLYDPANKVVRALIADYRDRFRAALAGHGVLQLDVHPFELTLGGEVVYLERDRERSLAFRLYRDGVRRLTFAADTGWDELLQLLQVLSIRYTGVRQQEDDLVTLLRKADFKGIELAAIEGFVPEEEHGESPLDPELLRGTRARYDPPSQWDTPLPEFKEAAPLVHRPLSEGLLARLRAEEADANAPAHALRAVSELLREAGPGEARGAAGFALEVREYLLVEGRADLVAELGRDVHAALAADAQAAFLDSWLDARTLAALIEAQPANAEPQAFVAELCEKAPATVLDRLFERLAAEGDGPHAGQLRALVIGGCRREPQALAARLESAKGGAAAALFRLLEAVDPEAAHRAALAASAAGDAMLQREALRHLAERPFSPELGRALHHLVESAHASVRLAALPVMAARGGPRVFAALRTHVDKHVARLDVAEAEAAGQALARASPSDALATFEAWLNPQGGGLLGKLVKLHAPEPLQRVALAGLRGIGGEQASRLIEQLAAHGDAALRPAAEAALVARAPGGRRG
jgi:hypothetical protein